MACPLSIVRYSGNLAGLRDALDIRRTQGELDLLRMRVKKRLHGIAKLERAPHRFRALVVRWDVQCEEGRAHSRFPKSGQIDMPLAGPLGNVLLAVQHPLKCIDVTVDADRFGVDATGALHKVLSLHGLRVAADHRQAQEEGDEHQHALDEGVTHQSRH